MDKGVEKPEFERRKKIPKKYQFTKCLQKSENIEKENPNFNLPKGTSTLPKTSSKIPRKILKLPSKNVGQIIKNWPENMGETDRKYGKNPPMLSEKVDPILTTKYTENIWVKWDQNLDRIMQTL